MCCVRWTPLPAKLRWEVSYPDKASVQRDAQSRCTTAYDNGKLYVFSKAGRATCFEAATGKTIWTRQLFDEYKGQQPMFGYSSSPLVDGKQVIFVPGGTSNGSVVALDKNTGTTLWHSGSYGDPAYGTPMVATFGGVRQYLVFVGPGMAGVDAETGKEHWLYPWVTSENCNDLAPLLPGGDCFIGISGYGHGCELVKVKDNTPTAMWKSSSVPGGRAYGARTCSPVLDKDSFYVVCDNTRLCCFDVKTGKQMWKQGGFVRGHGPAG